MDEYIAWTYQEVGDLLIKLANSTGEEYDEVRKEFDAMSVRYCFGMLTHVRQRDAEIGALKRQLPESDE